MKIRELLEMTSSDLSTTEQRIKDLFAEIGIIADFRQHFEERSIDGNIDHNGILRGNDILPADLFNTCVRIRSHIMTLSTSTPDLEGVFTDPITSLNIAFNLTYIKKIQQYKLYFRTICRRKNFKTRPTDLHIILR